MSERKTKKSDKYTETMVDIAGINETGGGDPTIDVTVRRYVSFECPRSEYPIELNAWQARQLAKALLKAAKRPDGAR